MIFNIKIIAVFIVFINYLDSKLLFNLNPLNKISQALSNFRITATTLDNNRIDNTQQLKRSKPAALDVRIDDTWYDLSGWRSAHPSGEHWIDLYRDRDATEVMHAFHSDKGRAMYSRLPKSKNSEILNEKCPPVTQLMRNFRQFRQNLEQDGWWNRDYFHEAKLLSIWACLFIGGLATAKTIPIVALVLLALSQTTAGWIGHDYLHGVDKFSFSMRNFGPLAAGLSPTWWSDKHNKHHAVTNELGVDEDLATEPFLYIYPPSPEKDSFLRRIQHIIFPLPMSLLFHVWKFDSLKLCISDALNGFKRKTQQELISLVIHYTILGVFIPLPLIFLYTTLAGFITAVIVTVTHQSEDLFDEHLPDFVEAQFRSTRDAKTRTKFTEWLWGGMQYQLEHHLFPSMPRSKYPQLAPILKQFASDNNVEYRVTDEWELLKLNIKTYQKISELPSSPYAKHFQGKAINWGGRGEKVV